MVVDWFWLGCGGVLEVVVCWGEDEGQRLVVVVWLAGGVRVVIACVCVWCS